MGAIAEGLTKLGAGLGTRSFRKSHGGLSKEEFKKQNDELEDRAEKMIDALAGKGKISKALGSDLDPASKIRMLRDENCKIRTRARERKRAEFA